MNKHKSEVKVFGLYGTRALLLVSGFIAAGIATMILFNPSAFFGNYGIEIGDNVNLSNELKAPAGALLVAGLVMMAGVFRSGFIVPSLATAAAVYLSYGFARVVSMAVDGNPHSELVGAAAVEIVIGAICFFVLMQHRRTQAAHRLAT